MCAVDLGPAQILTGDEKHGSADADTDAVEVAVTREDVPTPVGVVARALDGAVVRLDDVERKQHERSASVDDLVEGVLDRLLLTNAVTTCVEHPVTAVGHNVHVRDTTSVSRMIDVAKVETSTGVLSQCNGEEVFVELWSNILPKGVLLLWAHAVDVLPCHTDHAAAHIIGQERRRCRGCGFDSH